MKRAVLSTMLVVAAATTLLAQSPQGRPPSPPDDPLARFLIPPEMVLQHQAELGLTDAQRQTMQREMMGAQVKFLQQQITMGAEMEKLTQLLSATPVDEAKTLDQLDHILTAERDTKKAQITLLVRIRNLLTAEQRAKLEKMRQPKPD